jgi:hypothetical protein
MLVAELENFMAAKLDAKRKPRNEELKLVHVEVKKA